MSTLTTEVVNAALLAVKNKALIHYTQNSPSRWEGIHDKLIASKGLFPRYADCSSFATWCLWQALGNGADIVNGTDWKSGYTGTLATHGHLVSASDAQPGDLVFYGHPIYHVAIVIGRQNGVLICASHGEESGPYIIKYNQWGVNSIRRYLPTSVPAPAVSPKPSENPMHGYAVPTLIRAGSGQYFGLESGPNASHGGYVSSERPWIMLIQRFLNWKMGTHLTVDGYFHTEEQAAVTAFQKKYMPATEFYGQVWYDDWAKMASL